MFKKLSFFLCLGLLPGLQLCVAQSTSAGITEYYNLPYTSASAITDSQLQRLNLFLPETNQNIPLLIWMGGGAWSYGDRNMETNLARHFADAGVAFASVGHRLSPAVWRDSSLNTGIQHPKHAEDVAAAVKWLYEQAQHYGYDRNQIFIGGFSSGAHLASLVSLDPTYLEKHELPTTIFKGVIAISGAYDIVNYHQVFLEGTRPEMADLHVKAVFGPTEADHIHASPTSYLEHLSAPILLMVDQNMTNYTRLYEEKIRATGFTDFAVHYIDEFGHAALWRDMSNNPASTYRKLVLDFIRKQSGS